MVYFIAYIIISFFFLLLRAENLSAVSGGHIIGKGVKKIGPGGLGSFGYCLRPSEPILMLPLRPAKWAVERGGRFGHVVGRRVSTDGGGQEKTRCEIPFRPLPVSR